MYNVLTAIIAVLFVLGVMVLIHEWGHYIVAKSLGITVKVFSIGFGKRLVGFEKNGTDYRISALPFGGYVKMAGDNPMESNTDDPGEFNNHPRWHRFLVAIAGPTVNIVFAILLLACIFKFHYPRPLGEGHAPTVGYVDPDSPAEKAGLKPGDKIVRIDGKQNPDWMGVVAAVALSPNQPIDLTVERAGSPLHLNFIPKIETPDQTGSTGFEVAQPLIITRLEAGGPAEKAGIRIGDHITEINGHHIFSLEGFRNILQQGKGAAVQVQLVREGQNLSFPVVPKLGGDSNKPVYLVGVESNPVEIVKLPWGDAFSRSFSENGRNAKLILELVKKMIERKVSMKAMSGPVGIAQMSGEVARAPGWTPLLEFMCLISINLGIMNLFPIPILDGGMILMLAVEGLMRRDISLNLKERIYQASFVFLVLFAAIVVFNDIAKMR